MKKTFLALALIILTISASAQENQYNRRGPSAPETSLLANDADHIMVRFNLKGYDTYSCLTPRGPQQVINVPKMASMLETGAPDLPQYPIPVIIGNTAEMTVCVIDAKYTDYDNIEIAPSKGIISREIDPEDVAYSYGSMYSENAFYPAEQAILGSPYILRDFRGQNIMVRPFAYNPITKTLRVFNSLTIEMRKISDKGTNPKKAHKSHNIVVDAEQANTYARHFINYTEKGPYTFVEDEGEMLVICPEQYLQAMQPFVAWKNESGRPTSLINLNDIGGNDETQIKAYLKSVYDDPGRNLAFILLVGDYDDITPHAVTQGRSDAWFGQLEGTDNYIEALVGRFSVESVADVETHVNKVLYYERDMPATASWLNKGIGIADNQSGGHYGETDNEHVDFIRDTLLHYTYATVSQQYSGVGPGTNSELISADFNNGASICNYCSHGTQTAWSVSFYESSDVNALANDYRWPCIISVACLTGQFNFPSEPCFAETWMRATNNETGIPTGAIGGMFAWNKQAWQPPMYGQDEMNDILCEWRHTDSYRHTMGGALLNGNMKVLEMCPSDVGVTHNNWFLFGDPSLMLRTDNPTEMQVATYPETLQIGSTQLTVTSQSGNGLATLSQNGTIIGSQRLVNGSTTISFPALTQSGTLRLVVTGFNKVTHIQDITVVPTDGPFLIYEGNTLLDDNGQADYDETVDMALTIKNIGNNEADNVTITLTSESESVTVVNGNATLSSIPPQSTQTLETAFRISTANDIEDGEQATFKVCCSDGRQTWESHFILTLHAPVLELVSAHVSGDPQPGDVGSLDISIRNTGSGDARNSRLELYCNSILINIPNPVYHFGEIPANESKNANIAFSIDPNATCGSAFAAMFIASADHYTLEGSIPIHAGNIIETFENGSFADTTFHWSFVATEWTIDNSCAHTGNCSARSGAIGNPGVSELRATVNVLNDGQISFFLKTSSEAGRDFLKFYIDNAEMKSWSGITDWKQESFNVGTGKHIFKWIYIKDSSGSYGEDCAWIDDVEFPAVSTATTLDPVNNLEASIQGNRIDMSWSYAEGYSFIIRCNGEVIATTEATHFSEMRDDGTYLYSVTATDSQGRFSKPGFIIVDFGIMSLTEQSIYSIDIYPNPTRGLLNINASNEIRWANYTISNLQGQAVKKGRILFANGQAQCSVNDLQNGIYVLCLQKDNLIITRKIIKQ